MRVTEETKAAAAGVLNYIESHPEQHNQESWVSWQNGTSIFPSGVGDLNEDNICNTTLCAAGATVFLNEGVQGLKRCIETYDWENSAGNILGLETAWERDALFMDMDHENVKLSLKKISVGEQFFDAPGDDDE